MNLRFAFIFFMCYIKNIKQRRGGIPFNCVILVLTARYSLKLLIEYIVHSFYNVNGKNAILVIGKSNLSFFYCVLEMVMRTSDICFIPSVLRYDVKRLLVRQPIFSRQTLIHLLSL